MGWLILLGIGVIIWIGVGIYGWFSDKSTKIKANEYNQNLREQLKIEKRNLDQLVASTNLELKKRTEHLSQMESAFHSGILSGRKWLARFIAESDKAADDAFANWLRYKKHPAKVAARNVSVALAEKRQYKERLKFLEMQLASYEEYFPVLEEYREAILDEAVTFSDTRTGLEEEWTKDPVLQFIEQQEYERLDSAQRNQLALDRYIKKNHNNWAIGRWYERYLGYLYEKDGWQVTYFGIYKKLEDLGRDLLCSKNNETRIIQAKCWSSEKVIHEKHIFQLFGTTQLYLMEQKRLNLFVPEVHPIFVTTTTLSEMATLAAEWLDIIVEENRPLDKTYPMIKCNINQNTGEKIYHLPFDQQYDKTKIVPALSERYAQTAGEAEFYGFRRAFKWKGKKSN